jgi:hypothetical protein
MIAFLMHYVWFVQSEELIETTHSMALAQNEITTVMEVEKSKQPNSGFDNTKENGALHENEKNVTTSLKLSQTLIEPTQSTVLLQNEIAASMEIGSINQRVDTPKRDAKQQSSAIATPKVSEVKADSKRTSNDKGKFSIMLWNLFHSMWLIWVFTLGFLNFISFLYIGWKVKRKRWIFSGIVYLMPTVIYFKYISQVKNTNGLVLMILTSGIFSLIHAFSIRKAYLIRLRSQVEAKKAA